MDQNRLIAVIQREAVKAEVEDLLHRMVTDQLMDPKTLEGINVIVEEVVQMGKEVSFKEANSGKHRQEGINLISTVVLDILTRLTDNVMETIKINENGNGTT